MEFKFDQGFDDYLRAADANTRELLDNNSPFVSLILEVQELLAAVLKAKSGKLRPFAALTALNSLMLHAAAARTAFSGHASAVHPVFRTALESASYSFLMTRDESLEEIWHHRHRSDADEKACRRAFGSAVANVADALNEIEAGAGDIVRELYQASIDFGAHPNTKSLLLHMKLKDESDEVTLTLTGLWGIGSFEYARALLAVIEGGLVIASVLVPMVAADDDMALVAMHGSIEERKNALVAQEFGEQAGS